MERLVRGSPRKVALALPLMALCSACAASRDGSDGADPAARRRQVEPACVDVAAALCAKVRECSRGIFELVYGTLERCSDRQRTRCINELTAPGTSIDPQTYRSCVPAYAALACGAPVGQPADGCTPKPGALAVGAGCISDSQCASIYCAPNEARTGCGTCAAPPTREPEGKPCKTTRGCAVGLVCANGSCAAGGIARLGEACGVARPCAASLACSADKCVAAAKRGEACDPTGASAPPCDGGSGDVCSTSSRVCTPPRFAAIDAPCGADPASSSVTFCVAEGRCTRQGARSICVARTADGAACATPTGSDCLPGATCIDGVCKVPDAVTCG